MSRIVRSPARYVQGRGVTADIGTHAAPLGGTALVLGDEFVLGLVEDDVVTSLTDAGVDASSVTFGGECSTTEIDRIAGVVEERGADVVAEAACAEGETIHNEPFAVEPAMVRDAILTADRLGGRARAERS